MLDLFLGLVVSQSGVSLVVSAQSSTVPYFMINNAHIRTYLLTLKETMNTYSTCLFTVNHSLSTPVHVQELFFADGEVEKTISFSILDDSLPEDDEEFTILLSGPVGGAILGGINQSRHHAHVLAHT